MDGLSLLKEDHDKYHVLNGKSYIRWKRPDRAPDDLDLGPG